MTEKESLDRDLELNPDDAANVKAGSAQAAAAAGSPLPRPGDDGLPPKPAAAVASVTAPSTQPTGGGAGAAPSLVPSSKPAASPTTTGGGPTASQLGWPAGYSKPIPAGQDGRPMSYIEYLHSGGTPVQPAGSTAGTFQAARETAARQ